MSRSYRKTAISYYRLNGHKYRTRWQKQQLNSLIRTKEKINLRKMNDCEDYVVMDIKSFKLNGLHELFWGRDGRYTKYNHDGTLLFSNHKFRFK